MRGGNFCFLSRTYAHEYNLLNGAAVTRSVHKNKKVKYLSDVSNWHARHNNSLLSVQETDLVEKKRRFNYTEMTSVYYHKSKQPLNGFSVQNVHAYKQRSRLILTVKKELQDKTSPFQISHK